MCAVSGTSCLSEPPSFRGLLALHVVFGTILYPSCSSYKMFDWLHDGLKASVQCNIVINTHLDFLSPDGLEAKYTESVFHGQAAPPPIRRNDDMSFEQMLLEMKKKLSQRKNDMRRPDGPKPWQLLTLGRAIIMSLTFAVKVTVGLI